MNNKNPIGNRHYVGIDVLRFAAAVAVMAFHFCFLMGINPNGLVGSASQQAVAFPELYGATNFGWVGVQVFFVISGFVIAFSGEKAGPFQFFQSRVVRLGPAVWICAPLTLLATALVGFRPAEEMWRAFRHSVAFLPWEPWIDGSYWTLGIEIAFYTAVFMLIRFGRFSHVKLLAIVIGVVSSLFWILMTVMEPGASGEWAQRIARWHASRTLRLLLVHHGMFFAVGVLLWSELVKQPSRRNWLWIAVFCVTGCVQIAAESRGANAGFATHYSAALPCAIWLGSLAVLVWSVRNNALLHQRVPIGLIGAAKTAGMMTYPLYLLHQIIGGALMGAMVLSGLNRWLALAVTTAIILLATWLVATQLEPVLQKLVKRLLATVHSRYLGLISRRTRSASNDVSL